jgi:hypothetical protein
MNRKNLGTTVSGTLDLEDKMWVDSNGMYTQGECVRMGIKLLKKVTTELKSEDLLPKIDNYHKDGICGKTIAEAYSESLITKDDLKCISDTYLALYRDLQEVMHLLEQ